MHYSTRYSWKVRSFLTILALSFVLSLFVSVSSQDDRRRSRIRSRFRPKKRIENSEAIAAVADAIENDKRLNSETVGTESRGTSRQLRTRNRIRARRPQIITPEPPSLFDDEDEVSLIEEIVCRKNDN